MCVRCEKVRDEQDRERIRAAIEALTPEQVREIAAEVAAEATAEKRRDNYDEDDWYDRGERGQP